MRTIPSILILTCVLLHAANAAEPVWKLQPLKYNNPGLEVDLGVGLWAYPLPLDYDGDGDLDLLVSCPDKPTQGTYFFENPSQERSLSMPVFKPGQRIGDGYHYMLLSEVGGEPVVLRPGKAYYRDGRSGLIDFSQPKSIDVPTKPKAHAKGRTRGNMWRMVDYDDDGDQDLIIGIGDWTEYGWDHAYDSNGTWQNGPLHGYVYFLENKGTDQAPEYAETPSRLQAGGSDIDVYGWPCPNLADFDNDGDLDLLCGEFLDGFTYFQNVGTRNAPRFSAGVKLTDSLGAPTKMHLQMITPTAIDWDADGDLDLIVGDEDGRVAFVEQTGRTNDSVPIFEAPRYFRQQADELKFGALATPAVCDWDADGDEDILCGNTAGEIAFFENLGDGPGSLPKWNAPTLLTVGTQDGSAEEPFRVMAGPSGSIQGPCEAKWGYTTLSVADWDNDGDQDIIYNSILAELGVLLNENGKLVLANPSGPSEYPPRWNWKQAPSKRALTQWRTTPLAFDFDESGSLDLVMLDQQGYLTLRRDCGSAERVFVDENGADLQLNSGSAGRSGRVKLACVDWDQDGQLDILVNSENATWYRNCGTEDGRIVMKRIGNLAKRNVAGHTSSPATCDFDQNGKPDLLVGSENGRIYHIAHENCVSFPDEQLTAKQSKPATKGTFRGFEASEFIYERASFKQCHASTICETSRGLVAAWFGGSREGQKDVCIWTSYHDGLKWSSPMKVADGIQHDALRHPCWNPVLFQPPGDAPTLLFFKVGPNPREWWGEMLVSYDRGRTFGSQRRLPETIDGPVRCKPILIDGDTLLCGSSTESNGWRVHFEFASLVAGLPTSWKRVGPINRAQEFNAIQPTFLKHANGKLQVLCRTKEGVITTSFSEDLGESWSPLKATDLPNPNSGIESITLADGRHVLVYNPLPSGDDGWGKRSTLSLAISRDGLSWTDLGNLEHEPKGEFSYPAMIQSDAGLLHVTYTWKRQKIKHVILDPKKFQ